MANLTISGTISAIGTATIGGYSALITSSNQTYGIKLSNGLIINWGTVTPSSGGKSVSFAIPFTTTDYCASGIYATLTGIAKNLAVSSYSTTSMNCRGQWGENNAGYTNGDVTFTWIAIGK